MPDLIIQLIVVLLVCGFIYWAFLLLMPFLPVAEPFAGLVKVLVLILVGAIVLFYAIVPLINMLAHVHIPTFH